MLSLLLPLFFVLKSALNINKTLNAPLKRIEVIVIHKNKALAHKAIEAAINKIKAIFNRL